MENLSIAEFYKGRSVFITGATGFIGKALVEKLLRSCPDIECIYLLMRPLNGKTAECRLQEFTNNQIFENVLIEQPNAMKKIVSIEGDVILPGFGISQANLELLIEDVSVVFNSAATVRFNEKLQTAIELNVKGPLQLLELCRQMKRLEALVHVSTAYNNLDREIMEEEVVHSVANPAELVGFIDSLEENEINKTTERIIGNCPNTYTYTKGLADQLLEEQCNNNLPLAIVRPSMVTGALSEPIPGWVDNSNGPTDLFLNLYQWWVLLGAIAAIGTGFFRAFKANKDMVVDLIPVDFVINLLIAVAWHTVNKRPNVHGVSVYSSTTSQHNPITLQLSARLTIDNWLKFPSNRMIWYPSASITTSHIGLSIIKFLLHYVPASLLDLICLLRGAPMKWVRSYGKIHRSFAVLEFFMINQWRFLSNNSIRLLDEMSPQDRKIFYFDVRQINWENYFESYISGVRRFILKEDPKTLPQAEIKLYRLRGARLLLSSFLLFCTVYNFKNIFLAVFFIGILLAVSKCIGWLFKQATTSKWTTI